MSTTGQCRRRPAGFFTACRCDSCVVRTRRLAKLRRTGNLPPRRSDEAWAVIDDRLALGWTPEAIASAAGVQERTIRGGVARRDRLGYHTWSRYIADRVLASQPWPTTGMLPAVGATRRLRALAALGWSLDDLHQRTGMPMMTLSTIRSGKVGATRADTHRIVRDTYDALSMTLGPSERTRASAERAGWAPPLAWDDEALDHPDALPDLGDRPGGDVDESVVALVLDGQPAATTTAERERLVPILTARGLTDGQMAELMGTTANTVLRTRQRLGVQSSWTGVKVA